MALSCRSGSTPSDAVSRWQGSAEPTATRAGRRLIGTPSASEEYGETRPLARLASPSCFVGQFASGRPALAHLPSDMGDEDPEPSSAFFSSAVGAALAASGSV